MPPPPERSEVDLVEILKSEIGELIEFRLANKDQNQRGSPSKQDLRDFARLLHRARQIRIHDIPEEMLGEPAWDILLHLFSVQHPICVKIIVSQANIPQATGSRWLNILASRGWITKTTDRSDGRRTLVSLTELGDHCTHQALRSHHSILHSMWRRPLPA